MIKKNKFLMLLVCYISLLSPYVFAQNSTIDSLNRVLKTQANDTNKVNTLNALSKELRFTNTDSSMYFSNAALALAIKLNYEIGIAYSKVRIGMGYASLGKYYEGVKSAEEAVIIYKKLLVTATEAEKKNILKNLANAYNVTAHNRIAQGNLSEGLKSSFLALEVREKIGNKSGIADTEFNIGNIYATQRNYADALKHYNISLKLSKELGDESYVSTAYTAIGLVFFEQGNYTGALNNYTAALQLAEKKQDNASLAEVYIALAALNDKQGNYDKALQYNLAGLNIYTEMKNSEQIPLIYNNAGSVYMKQKKYTEAAGYLNKALSSSKQINSLQYIKLSYENLTVLDSTQGNYQKALEHHKLAISYRDSIINKENTKKLTEQQMQYEFDKKEDSLKQEHIITSTKLQAQKNQKYFYWVGLGMLLLLSFFVFNNFLKQKKINRLAANAHAKQKAELELQSQQALLSERLRISGELHDEVGATLSGISMYSHLVKTQLQTNNTNGIENSLQTIQQSSSQMVDKLNDIVWLLNPEKDSLQQLVNRLEDYAIKMAATKDIQVTVNIMEDIYDSVVSDQTKRDIYLLCKEAINNAVKHSQASTLDFSATERSGFLQFTIADNGQGFDVENKKRGNGIDNMQKRANDLGADFSIQSKKSEGCLISIEVKIPQ